jgi:hypothetical protein
MTSSFLQFLSHNTSPTRHKTKIFHRMMQPLILFPKHQHKVFRQSGGLEYLQTKQRKVVSNSVHSNLEVGLWLRHNMFVHEFSLFVFVLHFFFSGVVFIVQLLL